ncbi:MAG TPA: bifunctional [glutamine synthetase] adenylyltransferase/[glutamine synthetase]-adenylyl-L-tyrosine phosphorylase [Beijerinckiaceae bacterium]|nr:bifunctional [glutamine synthetase] adenylyltransferase/[glutamine synthetase]-adenylyl-L-tyrosine phosphorylase [Beijerinckiaceae bacterium]
MNLHADASRSSVETLAQRLRSGPRFTRTALKHVDDLCQEDSEGAHRLAQILSRSPAARDLLAGIRDGAGFLWRLILQDTDRLASLLEDDPQHHIERICAIARATAELSSEPDAMRRLRRLRAEAALLVALCDLGDVWQVDRVTACLSDFADACVQGAFGFVLNKAITDGQIAPARTSHPTEGLGMFILALGKHGARELNYSSDIDLTVFFDPEAAPFKPAADPQGLSVRMIKGLVRLLQDRNADGYVHRVDLRLRPDPGSTPIVMPVVAALGYYETVGQNWERAAMIKARPIAGDIAAGQAFLKELTPFIWRKYFDYAAISDIHAMKRQIYAVRGHEKVAIEGHDLKVGRGGIREIEFFVQTQQLVYGGRRPALRGARTLDMLSVLRADGWITERAEAELSEAYRFLRALEHRVQMVGDEQTQRLPSSEEDLKRFAAFCGVTRAAFDKALTKRLLTVEAHYARLFESMPGLASEAGSLVFTGVDDDPETLETLRKLGFTRPELAAETVRGWHFGRRTAVTTQRAREILTELVPALLEAFGNSTDPDAALLAFDTALGKLPAAVELFAILKNHPGVRSLFAEILGSAPRLAEIVSRRPHVLDSIVDPDFTRPHDADEIERRAEAQLARERDFEHFLEHARTIAHHEQFLVATQVVSRVLPAEDAGRIHAAIAEAFLRLVLARVEAALAERHGRVPGAEVCILGYGKLGSREMTATSDLDLVVVYNAAPDAVSDGEKPLYASEYYARLTQRLLTALSAPLRTGTLFEIDLRLRPSGRKGPVAVSLDAFRTYQNGEAETWEHMALCRARPVAGSAAFGAVIASSIQSILAKPRDTRTVARDVARMRALIEQEKPASNAFDVKMMPGGLVDLEFIAQYLVLTHASTDANLIGMPTIVVFENAVAQGWLASDDAETLIEAGRLYTRISQFLRIVLVNDGDVDGQPASFRVKLAQATGLPSYKVLTAEKARLAKEVRRIFVRVVGPVKA